MEAAAARRLGGRRIACSSSGMAHSLHVRDVRFKSAFQPIATKSRTCGTSVSGTKSGNCGTLNRILNGESMTEAEVTPSQPPVHVSILLPWRKPLVWRLLQCRHRTEPNTGLINSTGVANSYFISMPSFALSSLKITAIASIIRTPGFASQYKMTSCSVSFAFA